jgi:hypothetical protein
LLVVVLVVVGWALTSPRAGAADTPALAISMSPTSQEITLNPGQTQDFTATVINDGRQDFTVRLQSQPYSVKNNYTANDFDAQTTFTQITDWITFKDEDREFTLAAGTRRQVSFTVTTPQSVPAGGQYAAISAQASLADTGGGGVMSVYQISSLVLATVDGDTVSDGKVLDHQWQAWYQTSDITTSLTVRNAGNTHFYATNRLIVEGLFGGEIARQEIDSKLVFREDSRVFNLNWTSPKPIGIYKLTHESEFLGETVRESKWIVVLPIWALLVIIVALAAIVATIVTSVKKRRNHNNKKRSQ